VASDASMPSPVTSAPAANPPNRNSGSGGSSNTATTGIADNFQMFLTLLTTPLATTASDSQAAATR
jgi:flagellar basal-body rod modification protein FlgD